MQKNITGQVDPTYRAYYVWIQVNEHGTYIAYY